MSSEEEPLTGRRRTLDDMSVAELHARIADLKAQIAACEEMIARKDSHRAAAEAFFTRRSDT